MQPNACYVKGPLGILQVVHENGSIVETHWVARAGADSGPAALNARIRKALTAYWRGDHKALDALPVSLDARTPFQRRVLNTLRKVPAGRIVTYGELAKKAGFPGAARAVGSAMRANPVAVIVPCHRVVRGDGSLGNYSGLGGTNLKRSLLQFEKAL